MRTPPGRLRARSLAALGIAALMLAFGSGARSQDRGAWDPIRGFADGNVVINDPASTHRPDSPWSQYRAINTDLQGWSDNPGTIGGITITREGRRCGGLFRSGQC